MTLREEDLKVGRPFVHPETRLEYADFHAYLCGKDPLPHWRNARIKELRAGRQDGWTFDWKASGFDSFERFFAERVDYFIRCYTRDGYLCAAHTDLGAFRISDLS